MNELSQKIAKLVELCSKNNILVRNLWENNFLPAEVREAYKELESNKDLELFQLWRILGENIKIDPMKTTKYYLWDVAVEEKKDYAFNEFSELKSQLDEDGLIEVPYNSDLNKNGFKYKNKYLIFENAFSKNFHFTEWVIKNWKGNFSLKLPINTNCLGIPETRRNTTLLSHWQGPKTIEHVRESLADKEFIIKGPSSFDAPILDKTEFLFNFQNGQWHFQIEELIPSNGIKFEDTLFFQNEDHKFYTRYLHAITNNDLTSCNHIDGAIRVYGNYDKFKRRNSLELKNSLIRKECKRLKLFRIDADKGISSFQEIIGLFFENNPYVLEFFEGETEFSKELENKRTTILEIDFKHKKYE